ncbi:MAG: LptA/OstA family protein [Terriglobales bacterium]
MRELAPNPYTGRARRLLRLRQGVAAVLALAALAVGADYWLRRRPPTTVEAPVLGLKVQQSASGLTISKSEGNRPLFRVFAERADKLRQGGLDELHQVRIQVFSRNGTTADEISGSQFRYDEASGALRAEGLVHINLQGRLQMDARDLSYNVKQGTGAIHQGITFVLGSAQGSAAEATLDSHAGSAHFDGGVSVVWRRPGRASLRLASRQAQLQRIENSADAGVITLAGAAELVAGDQSLRADQFALYLRPDQTLRHLDARGQVSATNNTAARRLAASAADAHADFAPAGQKLEHLELDGGVHLAQTQLGQSRALEAGRVVLAFAGPQVLSSLTAYGSAGKPATLKESGAQAGSLSAPQLDFAFASQTAATSSLPPLTAITGQGRARIERGGMTAAADQLEVSLDAHQQPQLARATGNVEVTQTLHGVERRSRSRGLEVRFAAGARIAQVVETGGVQLTDGSRTLDADQLVYTPADGKAVLTGGVRGADPQTRFRAAQATWISHPDGSASLEAEAGATQLLSLSFQPQRRAGASGPLLQPGLPVVVVAHDMRWAQPAGPAPGAGGGWRGTARFSGAVRLMQAPNLLRADQLTIAADASGAAGELTAAGHVETDFVAPAGSLPGGVPNSAASRPVSITAAELQYSSSRQQAQYRGAVTLRHDGATMTAPNLTIYLLPGASPARLQRAVASGGVEVSQPGRRATANQLSYDFAQSRIEMHGGPPSILDAERGKITGDPLTFSLANDEIQVGGKPGTRVSGSSGGH